MLINALLSGLVMVTIINSRAGAINKRFDDMLNLCRAEIDRVNQVLDERLQNIMPRRKHKT